MAHTSGIKPEVKNLFEGYPIQNAEYTADDKAYIVVGNSIGKFLHKKIFQISVRSV